MNINLVEYLKENLLAGHDKYVLCNACISAGYSPSEVKKALAEVELSKMPIPPKPIIEVPPPPPPPKKEKTTYSPALFVAGIIIIVLLIGGIIFFTKSPSKLALLEETPSTIPEKTPSTQPATPEITPSTTPTIPAKIQCKECEYLELDSCKKAACCKDSDCDDGIANTTHKCEMPGTKDAKCVHNVILCGNGKCELGENCCLDCGCSTGFVCIENKCLPIKTPELNIISPKDGENVSSSFNVEIRLKDAEGMHVQFVMDKGTPVEFNGTKRVSDATLGSHELVIILMDKEKEVARKSINITVVPPPPIPKLTIIRPAVDEEIKGSTVNVEFVVDGITIGENAAHLHLTLDNKMIEHKAVSPYAFQNVAAGKHTLEAALVDAKEHKLTNPESFKTIPFSTAVQQSVPMPPSPPSMG